MNKNNNDVVDRNKKMKKKTKTKRNMYMKLKYSSISRHDKVNTVYW